MMPVQPGGFPSRWTLAPLWTLFHRASRRGHDDEPLLSVYREYGVVPRGFTDDNWNRIPDDLSNYQLVKPGDLVLNKMKAWQGSLGVSAERGIVSPAYFVYQPHRSNFEQRFLHHLLRSRPFVDSYGRMSSGVRVDQWDLDPWAFSRLRVPLPSLVEQRVIADFLDRETGKIDALIEKQAELITRLHERRQAVIDRELQDEEFAQLRRGVSLVTSGSRGWAEYFADEGSPFIRITNLDRGRYGLRLGDLQHVKLPGAVEGARTSLREGDVLFSITAYLGSVAVVPRQLTGAYVSQHVALTRLKAGPWIPEFVAYAAMSRRGQEFLQGQAYGGTKVQLSLADVRELPIPTRPLEGQQRTVDHLDRETSKIDDLVGKAERMIELSRERRSALITAAVTGQIDVNEHRGVA